MEITALQRRVVASNIAPERLAGNPRLSEEEKISEASRQFEAVLLRQILESSQKTVIKSKFSDDSTAVSIYRGLITHQLADCISKSGSFGLAKTFEQQLKPAKAADPTAETIQTRDAPHANEPCVSTGRPTVHSPIDTRGATRLLHRP